MSNRGEFVGIGPTSGNYIPSPVPSEQKDLPVYVNDELLRMGGTLNGILEGGALPPHSKLPKRVREGMIMNFSQDVGGGVDSSGVWLYKKDKWWKLIDDPSGITGEISEEIGKIEDELTLVDEELENLNRDLSTLDGKFPIKEVDISDNAISAPKIQANAITADKILANSIGADKLVANSITGGKISSATTIRAGTGNQSASLDGADSTWRLYAGSSTPTNAPFRVDKDGNLFANSGTFGGKIYAQMVDGDFTNTITKKFDNGNKITWTNSDGQSGQVIPIDLFDLKIRYPKPYKRIVRIDPIRFDMNSGGSAQWYHMIVHKRYLNPATGVPEGPEQKIVGDYDAAWAVYDDSQRKFNSSPIVHFEVPDGDAAQYRISIGIESNTTGGETRRQVVSCSLFKQGTELSFV